MNTHQEIASNLNEIWLKLSTRWAGDDANAFYRQYMEKMTEVIEDFETACSCLIIDVEDLEKRLKLIEYDLP